MSPQSALAQLLEKLKKFNELPGMEAFSHQPVCGEHDDPSRLPVGAYALIEQIQKLADIALITPEGDPHYDAMEFLKMQGFRVIPGETDCYGWVSGEIHTLNGKIVLG